jgi:biotin carboxyl carrier protein
MYEYTDTGVKEDTKYYYRIRVNEKRGTYKYSSVAWVETATNPTTAAAKAAQSAAESTKGFAEEAKLAAKNAETKTNQLYDYVTGLNLDNLNSKVEKLSSRMTGNINAVYTQNGATATTSDISPPIFISASGLTHFELSVDGDNWVGPLSSSHLNFQTLFCKKTFIDSYIHRCIENRSHHFTITHFGQLLIALFFLSAANHRGG